METCEICGITCKSGDMYRHKRLKHSEMKFICAFNCGKRFATAALKKNHEKTHTGQKGKFKIFLFQILNFVSSQITFVKFAMQSFSCVGI